MKSEWNGHYYDITMDPIQDQLYNLESRDAVFHSGQIDHLGVHFIYADEKGHVFHLSNRKVASRLKGIGYTPQFIRDLFHMVAGEHITQTTAPTELLAMGFEINT